MSDETKKETAMQPFVPQNLDQLYSLAKRLAQSSLIPSHLRGKPDDVAVILMKGQELGVSPLTSLGTIHVIEGKPAPHAHLIISRAKADRDCEWFRFVLGDDTQATWETKNRTNPEPTRLTYTIEQAQRAGMCPVDMRKLPTPGQKDSRGNWEKRPDEMLRKTCGVQLARLEYPEASQGLYAVEELER